jgi:hypothetical protein
MGADSIFFIGAFEESRAVIFFRAFPLELIERRS